MVRQITSAEVDAVRVLAATNARTSVRALGPALPYRFARFQHAGPRAEIEMVSLGESAGSDR